MPRPDKSAPLEEQVEAKLREDLLGRALVPGSTSATCPSGIILKPSTGSPCDVVYEGVTVPYNVQISDAYSPDQSLVSYTMSPMKALVVAKAVQAELYRDYGPDSGRPDTSKLACQEMPAVAVYASGSDTGFTCQYWSERAAGGKPGYTTLKVIADGANFQFEPVS
ncbi:hypothetical protein GCM10009759_43410 [Kitasatospora saccharophila]|uniref:LppA-like lipoprotein n=1 Tax=Kitasatospora saccharophila TaxID=407973 RepID=A0ABN2X6U7_9ACTN